MTAAAAIDELRRIRTAQSDDPERVVQLGRTLVNSTGKAAAGDECPTPALKLPDVKKLIR